MVYIRAKTVYGGINDYKANTYGFARVLRSIFAVLERVAKEEHVTPDGALALLIRELPLQESFQPVDKAISIDMRYENERLQAFLAQTNLGKRLYLLRVLEVLLRLDTRNGLEALDAFELAAVHTHRRLQAIEVSDTSSDLVEDDDKEEVVVTKQTAKKEKTKQPTKKASVKKTKDVDKQTTESSLSKIDEVLARGRAAIQRSQETLAKSTPTQRSQETLAKSGQTVATNPLLDDFLS